MHLRSSRINIVNPPGDDVCAMATCGGNSCYLECVNDCMATCSDWCDNNSGNM